MKTTIKIEKEVNITRLNMSVAVRYDEDDMPYDAPMREGDIWKATIDLDDKCVVLWPKGKTLEFDMKVCDQGTYTLFDDAGNQVLEIDNDYVPNNLLAGEYGDYLELKIDENGVITNWLDDANFDDFTENLK